MKRLIEIQNELKAPKSQRNSFGGYNYRSCEDILEAVKPLLKKQGLSLVISDDVIAVDGGYDITEVSKDLKTNKETSKHIIAQNRVYIKATATLYDSEGKMIAQTSALAREEETKKGMDASQLTGSTSSYARKYALNGLFAIDDTKDADAINTHDKENKPIEKPAKKQESKTSMEVIREVMKSAKTVDYLNKLWLMYKDKAEDVEALKQLCAEKKAEIMKGAENETIC